SGGRRGRSVKLPIDRGRAGRISNLPIGGEWRCRISIPPIGGRRRGRRGGPPLRGGRHGRSGIPLLFGRRGRRGGLLPFSGRRRGQRNIPEITGGQPTIDFGLAVAGRLAVLVPQLGEPVHGERDSVFGLSLHVVPPAQHPGGSVWCHCHRATAVLLPWPAYVRDRPAGDGH